MFLYIKSIISNYILKRDLIKIKRKKKLVTLSQAKKAVVLFDANSSNDTSVVRVLLKHLLKKNIDVDVLGFVNNTKMESFHLSTIHINYFNLNDLNYLGIPTSSKLKRMILTNYDILINLSLENSFPNLYLSLHNKASFKVGGLFKIDKFDYDFILKLKINSLDSFVDNVIRYLEIFDQNNEK